MNIFIAFSIFVKNGIGLLIGISLNLHITLNTMDILMNYRNDPWKYSLNMDILIWTLFIHTQRVFFSTCCFQFLSSVSYCFQCIDLSLLCLNLLSIFWFDDITNVIVYFISFSDSLLLLDRNAINCYILILYPATFKKLYTLVSLQVV